MLFFDQCAESKIPGFKVNKDFAVKNWFMERKELKIDIGTRRLCFDIH